MLRSIYGDCFINLGVLEKKKISLIAAISKNNVIGMDADIPWEIPGEQVRFRALTIGKKIIMGRKTFESIGRPLPNRNTIIVSRTQKITLEHCVTASSIKGIYTFLSLIDLHLTLLLNRESRGTYLIPFIRLKENDLGRWLAS
jgi:hypothetical protein